MAEYLNIPLEAEGFGGFTDCVVVRPPKAYPDKDLASLITKLKQNGFLPVLLPLLTPENVEEGEMRWFPTDNFREVGNWLFVSGSEEFKDLWSFLLHQVPGVDFEMVKKRIVKAPISFHGGDYVYLTPQKIFVYAQDKLLPPASQGLSDSLKQYDRKRNEETRAILGMMRHHGWQLLPVQTEDCQLKGHQYREIDLDWMLSLFGGKDGKPHAVVADSFVERMPPGLEIHRIPDFEAKKGGCNSADLRNGKVLIIPHADDAPKANGIFKKHARATLIESPPQYHDEGSGLRCMISSFSFR